MTEHSEHNLSGGSPDSAPRLYRIQIDKNHYETANPDPTGRELLELAGKVPPNQFNIYLRVVGAPPKHVKHDQHIDLRNPGVEKFVTLPLDQTEGAR